VPPRASTRWTTTSTGWPTTTRTPARWPARLAQIPGITVEDPETNLVFFDTTGTKLTADELAARIRKQGVALSTMGRHRARACTHLDVDLAGIETAVQVISGAVTA